MGEGRSRSRKKKSRDRREDKKTRSRSRDRRRSKRSRSHRKSKRSSSSASSSSSSHSAKSGNGPSDAQGANAAQKGALALPQNVFLQGTAGEVDENAEKNAERRAEAEKAQAMYDENGWLKEGVAPPPPPPGPPPASALAEAAANNAAIMTANTQSGMTNASQLSGTTTHAGSSGFSNHPPPIHHIPKGNASLSAPVCHYWIFGDCYKGSSCEMRHSSTPEEVQAVAMRCKRMACKRGAGCPKFPRCSFSHPQEMGNYVIPNFSQLGPAMQTLGRSTQAKVPMISDGVAMM